MFKGYKIAILKLTRNTELPHGIVEVNTSHISKKGDKFARNELVTVINNLNKTKTFVTIRGNQSLRKDVIKTSYDTAVDLNIVNISDSFNKKNIDNIVEVDLTVKKLDAFTYVVESVKTGNSVSRWLALIGIISAIDLLTNTINNFYQLIIYLLNALTKII
jgi:hypothetical protein